MTSIPATEQVATRRALHGVAELLLAGPQHRACGEIALRITPGGVGTVADPRVRTEGDHLVTDAGRVALSGRTYAAVGAAAGLAAGAPVGVYAGGSGAEPGQIIALDPAALSALVDAFVEADRALHRFAPGNTPVLWPEHFDVAVDVGEATYGVSPGDDYLAEPYAYVGPPPGCRGSFWNAPFGAARPLRDFADTDEVAGFFRAGHDLVERMSHSRG